MENRVEKPVLFFSILLARNSGAFAFFAALGRGEVSDVILRNLNRGALH